MLDITNLEEDVHHCSKTELILLQVGNQCVPFQALEILLLLFWHALPHLLCHVRVELQKTDDHGVVVMTPQQGTKLCTILNIVMQRQRVFCHGRASDRAPDRSARCLPGVVLLGVEPWLPCGAILLSATHVTL